MLLVQFLFNHTKDQNWFFLMLMLEKKWILASVWQSAATNFLWCDSTEIWPCNNKLAFLTKSNQIPGGNEPRNHLRHLNVTPSLSHNKVERSLFSSVLMPPSNIQKVGTSVWQIVRSLSASFLAATGCVLGVWVDYRSATMSARIGPNVWRQKSKLIDRTKTGDTARSSALFTKMAKITTALALSLGVLPSSLQIVMAKVFQASRAEMQAVMIAREIQVPKGIRKFRNWWAVCLVFAHFSFDIRCNDDVGKD